MQQRWDTVKTLNKVRFLRSALFSQVRAINYFQNRPVSELSTRGSRAGGALRALRSPRSDTSLRFYFLITHQRNLHTAKTVHSKKPL